MAEEIVNKVAQAQIEQIDLSSFKSNDLLMEIDLKNQLWNDLVLKEKDFRDWVKEHDWSQYAGNSVSVFCSSDAIIPAWAFMLVTAQLKDANVYCANVKQTREEQFFQNLNNWNIDHLQDKRVMVKGCSDIPNPNKAYVVLTKKLIPIVKSLMFGEPCSAVPVYKKK
ncbi:DUF2480 family protein [Paracrocinitomix mangrovi]|uniref:DUF2480 family protein n=1 Tax=Paracrocinitomix mangrovi TaxID=2862509 RepID=UPI001C8DF23B|nr:DUF2480 family protein [Paracrocinitomix mangrovi]UKN00776.1 DUF2480 family protein [Paracrocinitomix mangrovi]